MAKIQRPSVQKVLQDITVMVYIHITEYYSTIKNERTITIHKRHQQDDDIGHFLFHFLTLEEKLTNIQEQANLLSKS